MSCTSRPMAEFIARLYRSNNTNGKIRFNLRMLLPPCWEFIHGTGESKSFPHATTGKAKIRLGRNDSILDRGANLRWLQNPFEVLEQLPAPHGSPRWSEKSAARRLAVRRHDRSGL